MTHLGTFAGDALRYRGFNYTPPEPAVSLPQAILAGLMLACFALGVLALCVGLS